jgi:hypothetical protein
VPMTSKADTRGRGGDSYAVIWRRGCGRVQSGRLVLHGERIELVGTAPGSGPRERIRIEVPLALIETATVVRNRAERLRCLPTLALTLRGAGRVQVAVVAGAGRLVELVAAVTERLSSAEAV